MSDLPRSGDYNGPKGQIPEVWPLGNMLFMVKFLPLVSHVHQQNESEEKAEALLSHEMGVPMTLRCLRIIASNRRLLKHHRFDSIAEQW